MVHLCKVDQWIVNLFGFVHVGHREFLLDVAHLLPGQEKGYGHVLLPPEASPRDKEGGKT